MVKRSYCQDCEKRVNVVKVMCEMHDDCDDYSYECEECGTLNVDCQV